MKLARVGVIGAAILAVGQHADGGNHQCAAP